jgi:hypothetical protein
LGWLAVPGRPDGRSALLSRARHAGLVPLEDHPVHHGWKIRCRFAPGGISGEVAGGSAGRNNRENGQAHDQPEKGGDLSSGVERNRDEDPERDPDESRGDETPNSLQLIS